MEKTILQEDKKIKWENIKVRSIGEDLYCLIWEHTGELVSQVVYASIGAALKAAYSELVRVHGPKRGAILL